MNSKRMKADSLRMRSVKVPSRRMLASDVEETFGSTGTNEWLGVIRSMLRFSSRHDKDNVNKR